MKINWAERLRQQVHGLAESLGNLFVESFHYLALFAIGAVTAWAAVMEFLGMLENGHIKIDDILLLFIYLCGGILLLAFAILVVRYASSTFPSVKAERPRRRDEVNEETERGEL